MFTTKEVTTSLAIAVLAAPVVHCMEQIERGLLPCTQQELTTELELGRLTQMVKWVQAECTKESAPQDADRIPLEKFAKTAFFKILNGMGRTEMYVLTRLEILDTMIKQMLLSGCPATDQAKRDMAATIKAKPGISPVEIFIICELATTLFSWYQQKGETC